MVRLALALSTAAVLAFGGPAAGAGSADGGAGMPVDLGLLPSTDCVLDGLVGSIDLLHL